MKLGIFALCAFGLLFASTAQRAVAAASGTAATSLDRATEESEMRDVIVATFRAFGAFRNSIGMPESAAKDEQNATCVASGRCGLAAGLDQLRASAEVLRDELRGLKADENRLGDSFGRGAANALAPAAETVSRWNRLALSLRPAAASTLQQAATKLPGTLQEIVTAIRVAIDYLSYSGVATQPLEARLAADAKGP